MAFSFCLGFVVVKISIFLSHQNSIHHSLENPLVYYIIFELRHSIFYTTIMVNCDAQKKNTHTHIT